MARDTAAEWADMILRIRPILAGHEPEVIGTVLGDLVATWLAGHHPGSRQEARDLFDKMVTDLIPLCEQQIFERFRTTKPWDRDSHDTD